MKQETPTKKSDDLAEYGEWVNAAARDTSILCDRKHPTYYFAPSQPGDDDFAKRLGLRLWLNFLRREWNVGSWPFGMPTAGSRVGRYTAPKFSFCQSASALAGVRGLMGVHEMSSTSSRRDDEA